MRFHRPVVRREAVLLPSDPLEPLQTIRYAVRAAFADDFGATGVPENADGYRPHISLAYSNTAQPSAFAVDAVSLVEMHRDNRRYEWRTVEAVPLGGL
ncbi:2'-5' RNA ligase family protein [Kribbella sp. NPDC051936]|uniref:2'-5' RNA ligase family protein n=1 Tax=Kribbella sp. NPDC051936 TaxID=3154946 RepID=UPI00343263AD